jgi:hypothetical protein
MERSAGPEAFRRAGPRSHLAEADAVGDLGLREPLHETHVQDAPFPLGKPREEGRQVMAAVGAVETGVVVPDLEGALFAGDGSVEGLRPIGATRLHGQQHFLVALAEV